MLFRVEGKEYGGESALEIVQSIKRDASDGDGDSLTLREFLRRSLNQLSDRIHFRELDVSDRLDDDGAGARLPLPARQVQDGRAVGRAAPEASGAFDVAPLTHRPCSVKMKEPNG